MVPVVGVVAVPPGGGTLTLQVADGFDGSAATCCGPKVARLDAIRLGD